jgi:hypothetical protein
LATSKPLPLRRVGEGIQAVQPEFGQTVDGVLLLRENQRHEALRQLRVGPQLGSETRQQRALAHAALADDELVLRPAVGFLGGNVGEHALEDRLAGHEGGDDLGVLHPGRVVKRQLADVDFGGDHWRCLLSQYSRTRKERNA